MTGAGSKPEVRADMSQSKPEVYYYGEKFYKPCVLTEDYLERKGKTNATHFFKTHIDLLYTAFANPHYVMALMHENGIKTSPLMHTVRDAIFADSWNDLPWVTVAKFRKILNTLREEGLTEKLEKYLDTNPQMNRVIDHEKDPLLTAWANRNNPAIRKPENKSAGAVKKMPESNVLWTEISQLYFAVCAIAFLFRQENDEPPEVKKSWFP